MDEAAKHLSAIRRTLMGILLILTTIAVFFAKDLLLPIVLGLLLSLTLSPVIRAMQRCRTPAPVSATILIASISLSIAFGVFFMSGPVGEWVAEAPAFGEKVKARLSTLTDTVEAVKDASEQVEELTEPLDEPNVQQVTIKQPGLVTSAVSNLASGATSVGVALVLALLMLATGDLFYEKLVEVMPTLSDKKKALRIVYGIERSVSRYLFTISLINAGLGIALALCLALLGFPHPMIWGAMAFLLNFLPYVGGIIGATLIGAVSLITYDQLSWALVAPGIYVALNGLEGQLITPTILGRRLEMNTVSVFLTVIFWGWLWGIAGALMAVPFLVFLKVVCDNIDGMGPLGTFLGARKVALE